MNALQRGVGRRTACDESGRGKRVVGRGIVLRNQAIHGFGKAIAGIVAVATEAASDGIEVLMGSFYELCFKPSVTRLVNQRPPDCGFRILELLNSAKSKILRCLSYSRARLQGRGYRGFPWCPVLAAGTSTLDCP